MGLIITITVDDSWEHSKKLLNYIESMKFKGKLKYTEKRMSWP